MPERKAVIIDLQYLPCIQYIYYFLVYEEVCIDIFENYVKQSYRNRCRVLLAEGVHELSVPIVKPQLTDKQIVKEVEIDYRQKWLNNHWRTIASAYGKAPFFVYYADYFHQVYFKKYRFLWELNMDLLTICLDILKIEKKFKISDKYIDLTAYSAFVEGRSAIHPKKETFMNGLTDTFNYPQLSGKAFVPNLSIIDLILCEGPQAGKLLKNTVEEQKRTNILFESKM